VRRRAGAFGLAWADVAYADGGTETYLVGPEDPLELVRAVAEARAEAGFRCTALRPLPRLPDRAEVRPLGAEQSNSSFLAGGSLVLKVFRRPQDGPHPELEVNRHLAAAGFRHVPPLYGWVEHEGRAVALLQGFVPNAGDGWTWTLAHFRDPDYLAAVRLLGRVTAEMHAALARMEPPEPISAADARAWTGAVEAALDAFPQLPRGGLRARAAGFAELVGSPKVRVHGDYHLGQVLRTADRFVVLDFEGEPARPTAQRRAKASPLKDVAGMLRSFAYARHATGADAGWEERARRAFLDGYGGGFDPRALAALELEKALYELRYELAHRPEWARVPLAYLRG
jgi:maltokinase